MSCPQCQNGEIDSSGTCGSCGYAASPESPVSEAETAKKDPGNVSGAIEVDYSDGDPEPPSQDEVPSWRKELSQRLQAIKQKRETEGPRPASIIKDIPPEPTGFKVQEDPAAAALRAEIIEKMKARKPAPKPPTPIPLQKTLQPLEPHASEPILASGAADPQRIQNLIDSAVSRKPVSADAPGPAMEEPLWRIDDLSAVQEPADSEGKLILLSRTLSGLVDLILVVLLTGAFVISADYFSGIIVLDAISLADFAALFLLTYFGYSIYFLATSNQTVGMMITELRVVGAEDRRPQMRQVIGRCCGFLVSLLFAGIGLLWGLFDRENRCLHDRISGTYVIRI